MSHDPANLAAAHLNIAAAAAAALHDAPPRDPSMPEPNPLNDEPTDGPLIEGTDSDGDSEPSPWGTCSYCGEPADKRTSGVPQCWPCWRWEKLDGPAARHWSKVGHAFLSNIDGHDLASFFPKAGISGTALTEVRNLVEYCDAQIASHTTPRGKK